MVMSILSTCSHKNKKPLSIPRDGYAEWAAGLDDIFSRKSKTCKILELERNC